MVATKELKVVGGAVMRYAIDPPRVPGTFGANFALLAVFVFDAGGWPHEASKNASRTNSDTRRNDVNIDIRFDLRNKTFAGFAQGVTTRPSLRGSILQINTLNGERWSVSYELRPK